MSPRPSRRPAGMYPNLLCTDALTGGRITLFRNPADKVFGEKDAYAISADWSTPDGISAAYAKAEEVRLPIPLPRTLRHGHPHRGRSPPRSTPHHR